MQFRTSTRLSILAFGLAALPLSSALAQSSAGSQPGSQQGSATGSTATPQSSAGQTSAPQAPSAQAPSAQQPAGQALAGQSSQPPAGARTLQLPGAPAAANANPFPPVDPHNFTASTPTKETVDSFLRSSWGYDTNRTWQVQAILKTAVPNLSKVVVLVAEKGGPKEQTAQLAFFALPDGKHLISDEVLPFGPKPFDENRRLLQTGADGPSKGASAKDLEFVEFSDFQCPHCKDAQPTIAKLLADYPNAHYVYESFPLMQVHSEAQKASAYGVCVAKAGGNDAFFKFADAVFDAQAGLTPETSDQTLKAAVTKAGQDAQKVATCSTSPETSAAVQAVLDLGERVGVASTPTIFINGRGLPLSGVPYETMKQIINFQAQQDGVSLPASATAPAPPAPSPK